MPSSGRWTTCRAGGNVGRGRRHLRAEAGGREEGPAHREGRHLELLVDPGGQEGPEGVVRHHVRDDQAGGHDPHQQQEEAEAEGHVPASRRPAPAAAPGPPGTGRTRMLYPMPRTVRISGGPWASSFLRR